MGLLPRTCPGFPVEVYTTIRLRLLGHGIQVQTPFYLFYVTPACLRSAWCTRKGVSERCVCGKRLQRTQAQETPGLQRGSDIWQCACMFAGVTPRTPLPFLVIAPPGPPDAAADALDVRKGCAHTKGRERKSFEAPPAFLRA